MERRKFLLGVSGTAIGGGALLGSGAFTRIESQRAVTIEVAEDPDAYLGLDGCPDSPNSSYTEIDEKGHLAVEMSSENPTDDRGYGINSDSRSYFDDVFQICNQGKQPVCVWIEDDDWPRYDETGERRVEFYVGESVGADDLNDLGDKRITSADNGVTLGVGDCVCVGVAVVSKGLEEGDRVLDELDDEIVIHADADACDPADCVEPTVRTWSDTDEDQEEGGPVILMGLDSELSPDSDSHGPREDHAAMAESLLDNVTNGGEGILVLGTPGLQYWDDLGDDVGEAVTYEYTPEEIANADFEGYALVGIASSDHQLGWGQTGVTDSENAAIIDRAGDIADFVNEGGGLLGKTQEQLNDPWGYVDPFGEFETNDMGAAQYDSVIVTDAGLDLGLTQEGMDGWCCYHETFENYPDFFEMLIEHDDPVRSPGYVGEAAAIGGEEVIIEREVSLEITGPENVEVGGTGTYDVRIENGGEEPIDGEFEVELVGDGTLEYDLPDDFDVGAGEDETWDGAIDVTCDHEGAVDLTVRLVDDGGEIVAVTAGIDCIADPPGVC